MLAVVSLTALSAAVADIPGGGFGIPIDCTLGTSCWIVNYPDAGPKSTSLDFRCNHLTYDGHEGTDFAVRDLAAMRQGVAVVSAAAGRILRVRDGMNDAGSADMPDGRGCGNGVVISHGGGWETRYCHLRKGSVTVRPGESVRRGDRLGMVGMSGRTVFPHVELTIRRHGTPLDPFTGREVFSGCGAGERSLWHERAHPAYSAFRIVAAGFATGAVDMAAIQRDAASPTSLSAGASALVLWAVTLGVEPGDRLGLSITGPDGSTVFSQQKELERTRIRRLDYGGRRLRGSSWTPGVYIGEARLLRPGSDATEPPMVRVTRTRVTLRQESPCALLPNSVPRSGERFPGVCMRLGPNQSGVRRPRPPLTAR